MGSKSVGDAIRQLRVDVGCRWLTRLSTEMDAEAGPGGRGIPSLQGAGDAMARVAQCFAILCPAERRCVRLASRRDATALGARAP